MASTSQLSQPAEEEELINEVVNRTPDTLSDHPSSLEKRPFLCSDEEDTGDSDDESNFEEPVFTLPKKGDFSGTELSYREKTLSNVL